MQKGNVKLAAVAAVVIVIVLLFSWQYTAPEDDGPSSDFADALAGGDCSAAYDSLAPELRAEFDALGGLEYFEEYILNLNASEEANYGPLVSIGDSYRPDADGVSCTYMDYAYSGALLWTVESDEGVVGFYITPRDLLSDQPLPDGIVEEAVQVGPDGMSKLDGLIASSEDSDHSVAVVLVSGSGPNGMNCGTGHSWIFQQLAWGLAEQGVDVLRYDDRTYSEPWTSLALGGSLDIDYETVDDAVAAAALLKSMGYEKVYVVGHSLGAMMAPAIVEKSDGLYDGMVSLAGSPRSLAEISYDQNMLIVDQMPDGAEKDFMIQYLEAELQLSRSLDGMTDGELMSTTVFGMPAYYLKSIDDYDVASIAQNLEVPMLFLQGTSDWQVTYDSDYSLWMQILEGKENVQSQAYVGLNHLFSIPGQYDGTSADYYLTPMTFNQSVIDDIAEFVLSA